MPPAQPISQDARSLADVHSSVGTSQVSFWRRMFAFAGPAYLVSVGYMDPGNWATDLEGGARSATGCSGCWSCRTPWRSCCRP